MKAKTKALREAVRTCVSCGEMGNILTGQEILDIIDELEAAERGQRVDLGDGILLTPEQAKSRRAADERISAQAEESRRRRNEGTS